MTKTYKDALAADRNDPLAKYINAFLLPEGVIYLDGNSLGPPVKASLDRIRQTAFKEWGEDLITSWNKADWIGLPRQAGAKIARIIGVPEDDVIVADSVSVNIFKLAGALLQNIGANGAIAYERGEFPTDGYILQGLAALTRAPLVELEPDNPDALRQSDIRILIKSAVRYKSAEIADVKAWEQAAAAAGTAIIWDLSHAAGVIDLALACDGASYAVGCGYKFLNGGPGAPAYLYVATDKAAYLRSPLSGWMGHAAPFDFSGAYEPAAGVSRFACGTPPILSLAAMDAALDLYGDIDMRLVEEKSQRLGDFFLACVEELGLENASPAIGERRGGHVSLRFEGGYEAMQALIACGVIGDFRAPDLMRFGFSPLFLQYTDVLKACDTLKGVIRGEIWRAPEYATRSKVT